MHVYLPFNYLYILVLYSSVVKTDFFVFCIFLSFRGGDWWGEFSSFRRGNHQQLIPRAGPGLKFFKKLEDL